MFQKTVRFIKKYSSTFLYVSFGMLTTLVNYVVYLPLYNYLEFPAVISNAVAWLFSVIFAFITNKPFVFKSLDWSNEVWIPEFVKFVSCRFISGVFETIVLFIAVDFLKCDGNIWKIISSIFVIIFNYFASKLFVFHKK